MVEGTMKGTSNLAKTMKNKKTESELQEEFNEAFVKGIDISKEKLDDDETGRSKPVVEFDSIKLN